MKKLFKPSLDGFIEATDRLSNMVFFLGGVWLGVFMALDKPAEFNRDAAYLFSITMMITWFLMSVSVYVLEWQATKREKQQEPAEAV